MSTPISKKHSVILSQDDEKKLAEAADNPDLPDIIRKRAKIILTMNETHGSHYTYQECAEIVGVAKATVNKIVSVYFREGLDSMLVRKRSPLSDTARLKANTEVEDLVMALAASNPPDGKGAWSLRALERRLSEEYGIELGKDAVGRILKRRSDGI